MTADGIPRGDFNAAGVELRGLLGDGFSTAPAVLEHHSRDESWHPPEAPDGVCFPTSTAEVVEIVKICGAHRVPIIPFGAGTSLEGHVLAPYGGVSLDLSLMDRILAIHAEDLDVTVEAGVTRLALNRRLADLGLFFPVDPGADATLGGMAATRASGTNAVRYGTMRENVLALEVVTADGRVIRTSRRARKSSAGYDLTRLFVGSEGTLGVITEICLRLHGVPEAISAAVVSFSAVRPAVDAAISAIQAGVPLARIELLDEKMMRSVNRYSRLDHPEQPTLFLEFHGSRRGVEEQAAEVEEIARELGGGDFRWATHIEEREKLWQARHQALYAALAMRPGAKGWSTDVCVPISRLADCIAATREDLQKSFIPAPLVGHVGDGNFHLIMLIDPSEPAEIREAERLHERLVARALAMDGTCTGEHGVGLGKRQFLATEHGEGLEVMRQLKRALDPGNLMNPGKIL
ncbi:MAG: FAD-binding protein [bacterium]|nr:FAD-binding protein [bacterium]